MLFVSDIAEGTTGGFLLVVSDIYEMVNPFFEPDPDPAARGSICSRWRNGSTGASGTDTFCVRPPLSLDKSTTRLPTDADDPSCLTRTRTPDHTSRRPPASAISDACPGLYEYSP